MNNSLYIPILSMNLPHYLSSGIMAPSIYIDRDRNEDIQNKFEGYLLLSSVKFTKGTNCAIEVVLDKNEKPRKISEHFLLLDMPLPISRIKNIYFTDDKQKKVTKDNIVEKDSAFIPERLLKVSKDQEIDLKELDSVNCQPSEKKWEKSLKKYDQLLGGFSVMKIGREEFQNYPTHYFSALGNINTLFKVILQKQNIDIGNNLEFAFDDNGRFKELHNTIYSKTNYEEVEKYANAEKVRLEKNNGLIKIDKIPEDKQTYLVAILENYGEGKRKKNDDFISDLISGKFLDKKKEGLSLIFGINKGYKVFRSKYRISKFEVDIKFHLDSKLDYYIIESIYQNVFNSLDNIHSFDYIDNLFPESEIGKLETSEYMTYQVFDEKIIWKKRVPPIEEFLSKITQKISNWFSPNFIQIKKTEIESDFTSAIECFKIEIETEVSNKYKVKIEELNKTISKNIQKIQQLEHEVEENKKLTRNKNSKSNSVKNNRVRTLSLFDEIPYFYEKNIRKILNENKVDDLLIIASKRKIKVGGSLSKVTKNEIIDKIIENEFPR